MIIMICLDETDNFYLSLKISESGKHFYSLLLLVSDCLGGSFILRGRSALGKLIMQ